MVLTVRNRSLQPEDHIDTNQNRMEEAGTGESRALLQGDSEVPFEPLSTNPRDDDSRELIAAENPADARHYFQEQLSRIQGPASILSHILAVLAVILVISWIEKLGGLSWQKGNSKLVFNWHPLLMILAFCFMTVASLAFRAPYKSSSRWTVKLVHGSAWLVAAICATIALIAVFKSHNDPVSGFIANLYSLHSWIGMAVIGLFVLQFLTGFFTFGYKLERITPAMKAKTLVIHSFVGPFIYIATAATILLGIQEKEGFVKCAYNVDKADLFPLAHIGEIPSVCKVSHSLGIVVLATALCTIFAMYNFQSP